MSDIVLSASVRQNLLSLQSTAALLATTQNRLSTGKKVNTALDNPTNYFTAAGLDNRASDISNLLDSIGNGVQVLQAANTGITSLQKLVDTAKSIGNQVLQAPAGYSVKASATTAAPTGAGPPCRCRNCWPTLPMRAPTGSMARPSSLRPPSVRRPPSRSAARLPPATSTRSMLSMWRFLPQALD